MADGVPVWLVSQVSACAWAVARIELASSLSSLSWGLALNPWIRELPSWLGREQVGHSEGALRVDVGEYDQ